MKEHSPASHWDVLDAEEKIPMPARPCFHLKELFKALRRENSSIEPSGDRRSSKLTTFPRLQSISRGVYKDPKIHIQHPTHSIQSTIQPPTQQFNNFQASLATQLTPNHQNEDLHRHSRLRRPGHRLTPRCPHRQAHQGGLRFLRRQRCVLLQPYQ